MGEPLSKEARTSCQICINHMQLIADAFYASAVKVDNHAFIEWTGLLNEYIKACGMALEAGQDFRRANKHTGEPLPLQGYMVDYLNEKLGCIFNGAVAVVKVVDPFPEGPADEHTQG